MEKRSSARRCLLSDYSEMGATTERLISDLQMTPTVRPTQFDEQNGLPRREYRVMGMASRHWHASSVTCNRLRGKALLLPPQRQAPRPSVPRQSQHVGSSAKLPAKRPIMKTGLILHIGGRRINGNRIISHALLDP
ncbi:hypothetical protein N7478_003777 [Penicillium angulare]|uniref:uncharacterized protein n=1 Tax=Penicillium angulare TaxID=116970 RepID=UPI002541597E|nr:uncharacterized protein N7478_003777 [Penicillium angulare]KAJ5288091.1 hypothetical protein N7478_003777 [Penicillium angulare]